MFPRDFVMSLPGTPYTRSERWPHARRDRALSAILRGGVAIALLSVLSRVLRLALVVWLGISALAWGVIFAMIGLFKIFRKPLRRFFPVCPSQRKSRT